MTDPARRVAAEARRPTTNCPGCGAESVFRAHAVVAPFIAELTGTVLDEPVTLRHCPACTLGFFDPSLLRRGHERDLQQLPRVQVRPSKETLGALVRRQGERRLRG